MTETGTPTRPFSSTAHVGTDKASRYLQQLCKHFQHKLPVTFDETAGDIAFDGGECRLAASASELTLHVSAPSQEALARLEDVVARHLVRFAFREEMSVDWVRDGKGA